MTVRVVAGFLSLTLATVAVPALSAQSRRSSEIDFSELNTTYDGRFTFVRLRYSPLPGFSRGGYFGSDLKWDHDYPRAERHFTKILSEITAMKPNVMGSNILTVDDPELLKYPVAYLAEPGFWSLTESEAAALRDYLLKGGFLIIDDFADMQWYNFAERMKDVLPDGQLVELDASHPIFHSFFDIEVLNHRHPYWGQKSEFHGIFEDNDPNGRLLVIVNYNNDIGESWEWSDSGFILIELTNEAYKLGVNYIVYAMTH